MGHWIGTYADIYAISSKAFPISNFFVGCQSIAAGCWWRKRMVTREQDTRDIVGVVIRNVGSDTGVMLT